MPDYTISYAQNREDILLGGFFNDVTAGFYVDVGANEPEHHSVTKYFYDRGWSGINIEPIPELSNKLKVARPRDINLQIGVGKTRSVETLNYYPEGNGLSTFSDKMAKQYEQHKTKETNKVKKLKIEIWPLKDILAKYAEGKTINFMKIDVEGFEKAVIEGNDWKRFRPEVLCIEANHLFDEWEKILVAKAYLKVFFDGINNYYVAKEAEARAKQFSYVQTIIGQAPIYYELVDKIERADNYDELKEQYRQQIIMNQDNRQQIQELNQEISRPKTIKQAIKTLAVAIHNWNLKAIDRLRPDSHGKTFKLAPTQDTKQLLDSIQAYDKENEVTLNSRFGLRSAPYIIASNAYGLIIKMTRKTEHIIRTILHKMRNR